MRHRAAKELSDNDCLHRSVFTRSANSESPSLKHLKQHKWFPTIERNRNALHRAFVRDLAAAPSPLDISLRCGLTVRWATAARGLPAEAYLWQALIPRRHQLWLVISSNMIERMHLLMSHLRHAATHGIAKARNATVWWNRTR